jgi:hypothetical protein
MFQRGLVLIYFFRDEFGAGLIKMHGDACWRGFEEA